MQPYDPTTICPKCGNDQFTVHWNEAEKYRRPDDGPRQEHISVVCNRCRYQTFAAPLDSVPAAAAPKESSE